MGIIQAILWYMLPVVTVFLILIYFKVSYDAKEGSKEIPSHAERIHEVYQVLPGIGLLLMEIAVLAAVSEPMSRGHQERLALMVREVMAAASAGFDSLDRIAVTLAG